MLPRSRILRLSLIVVPLILVALLWNAARQRPRFVATPVPAQSLALSHDGKQLAFSIQNDEVFWSKDGKHHRLPLEYTSGFGVEAPIALQFSRDGKALLGAGVRLLANKTPAACQWDLASDRLAWSVTTYGDDNASGFAFSPDGKSLAQRLHDIVKVVDLTKIGEARADSKSRHERAFPVRFQREMQRADKKGRSNFISSVALTADGATLITVENFGNLQFWDIATRQQTGQTPPVPLPRAALTVAQEYTGVKPSPDGRFVAIYNNIGVALWDTTTKQWTLSEQTLSTPHNVVWMPDSRSLWMSGFVAPVSDADKTQQLSVPALKPLRVLPTWGPIAVAGDGHTLATRADNAQKGVWLWNIE